MSAAVEARTLIGSIAGPAAVGGKVKEALDRVARVTGLPHRRVRGIWNNEARIISAEEMDCLRRAAAKRTGSKLNDEFSELRARIAQLEQALARLTDGAR